MLHRSAVSMVTLLLAVLAPGTPADAGEAEQPPLVTTFTVQGLVLAGGTVGGVQPARDTTTLDLGGGGGIDLELGWRRPRNGFGLAAGIGFARAPADIVTPLYGGLYGVARESERLSRIELRAAGQVFLVDGERTAVHLDGIIAYHRWSGSTSGDASRLNGPAMGASLTVETALRADHGWRLAVGLGGRLAAGSEVADAGWIWQAGIGFSRRIEL